MNFEVVPLRPFEKQLKRLVGKYPSLKQGVVTLVMDLSNDGEMGTALGGSSFKIRLAIASKGKGKSGGARVVTHVKVVSSRVYLLSIYDKSEKDTLSDRELKDLLALILE